MFKRVNWYILFGVAFVVIGILDLFSSQWLDAAWSLALGGGSLFVSYARTHPALNRGWLGWTLAILFIVIFATLTILRMRTP